MYFDGEFARMVYRNAGRHGTRIGQELFNMLPMGAGESVVGTPLDLYQKHLELFELEAWINNHLIFNDNGMIIAIFDEDKVLWETS